MAEIYNSAILTIVSATGENANARLFSHSICAELRCTAGIWRPRRPERLAEITERTVYDKRAWTFQEWLLSRRRLVFTKDVIYYRCRSDIWCGIYSSSFDIGLLDPLLIARIPATRLSDDPSGDRARQPTWNRYPLLSDSDLEITTWHTRPLREWPDGILCWDQGFRRWADIVRKYTSRRLSYQSDVLRACAGILTWLQGHCGWTFYHGIPEPLLAVGLLWIPGTHTFRRVDPERDNFSSPYPFPTWSWTGWIGEVTFAPIQRGKGLRGFRSRIRKPELLFSHGRQRLGDSLQGITEICCFGNEDQTRHQRGDCKQFDFDYEIFEKSTREDTFSSLQKSLTRHTLSFQAETVRAKQFLSASPSNYLSMTIMEDDGKEFQQPWQWLLDKYDRSCGVLYGVHWRYIETILTNWADDLDFVLISESQTPPFVSFPQIFRKTHESGIVELDARKVFPDFRHEWTAFNVLLVRWIGQEARRLAVGQIQEETWRKCRPRLSTVRLV
jgi:hypothetical protein